MDEVEGLISQRGLQAVPSRLLLATYESILMELRDREVVRTNDAPAGQYAEWLAWRVFGGELAHNSVKSYDLLTPEGDRIQVKARVLRKPNLVSERQLSPFRSFDFEKSLVILFDRTYGVLRAVLLPCEIVRSQSTFNKHVNGSILIARDTVLLHGEDVTDLFREFDRMANPDA